MASYVDVDGKKFLRLDDGSLVPCTVGFSLQGGSEVKLTSAQLTNLRNPILPAEYPLPASQVTALQSVSVGNFPSSFSVSNFPSSFSVSNLPSTYQWPSSQETIVTNIRTAVQGFTKGLGVADANTLRMAIASDSTVGVRPPYATMSAISFTATSTPTDYTIITPAAGKALRITEILFTSASFPLSVIFNQGTTGQGQTVLGSFTAQDYVSSLSYPLALAADRSFVIRASAFSSSAVTGYIMSFQD